MTAMLQGKEYLFAYSNVIRIFGLSVKNTPSARYENGHKQLLLMGIGVILKECST